MWDKLINNNFPEGLVQSATINFCLCHAWLEENHPNRKHVPTMCLYKVSQIPVLSRI